MNGRQKRWAGELAKLRREHRRQEAALLLRVLETNGWGVTAAARALGLRLSSLQAMIARHPQVAALQAKLAPGLGRDEAGRFAPRAA